MIRGDFIQGSPLSYYVHDKIQSSLWFNKSELAQT